MAKVEKPLPVLAQARKDVVREEREAEITGNAKARSMAAFDELFGVVATFTSAMLDLIGEDELASRVKPSVRRRGVTAEGDEPEDGSASGGDAEGDGGGAPVAGSDTKAPPKK